MPQYSSATPTGDYRIDALLNGDHVRWNDGKMLGTPTSVTYSFMTQAPAYYNGRVQNFAEPTEYLKNAARTFLLAVSNVARIDFVEVASGGQIELGTYTSISGFGAPGDQGNGWGPNTDKGAWEGDLWINNAPSLELTAPSTNRSGDGVQAHELMHVLGLKHPGQYSSYDVGPFLSSAEDNTSNTFMSYYGATRGKPLAPAAYDALVLEFIYGPRAAATLGRMRAGNDGADELAGDGADNILQGYGGNDRLTGGAGNDQIDGGSGSDTAVFTGTRAQYSISTSGAGTTVTDNTAGRDGIDTLLNVERLKFADGTLVLDGTSDASGQAYRLYRASLGRSPDNVGLGYQTNRLDQGTSLENVAAGFIASPEFEAKYGALSNAAYVGQLYQNVLGRTAGASEIAYHVARLEQGVSRQGILVGFSESPEFITNTAALTPNGIWFV